MEPKFEPKQYTPEEIAELEKSRTISDAELLKDGAEYVVGEGGEKQLNATEQQKKEIFETGNLTDEEQLQIDKVKEMISSQSLRRDDGVHIYSYKPQLYSNTLTGGWNSKKAFAKFIGVEGNYLIFSYSFDPGSPHKQRIPLSEIEKIEPYRS